MIITISRQLASLGNEIAASLSQKTGFDLISRSELLERFLPDATPHELHMLGESARFYLSERTQGVNYESLLRGALHEYAKDNSAVLVGFGSRMMFQGELSALHVRVTAPLDARVGRIKKRYRVSAQEAHDILVKSDKKQARFVRAIFGADIGDASLYDAVFNTASLSADECVFAITALIRERELSLQMREPGAAAVNVSEVPVFKNEAESEFARLLDMYNIEWKYEPKTFPIEWDAEGNVKSAFSPDFYLPGFDTFIEVTAMNQKYVTAKNKKLRRMRELYPGTNVRIVYKKDFGALFERFNLGRDIE